MDVNRKKVVILGLGESGREAAKLLRAQGALVTVCEREDQTNNIVRQAEELRNMGLNVVLGGGMTREEKFDLAVLSPGIPPESDWVQGIIGEDTLLLGEMEVASWFCTCPLIAITGTNGKSTTTELVESILKTAGQRTVMAGNIGRALSSVAAQSSQYQSIVVEVSSFQLETIRDFHPRISVHLNLTPDHLDRYPTIHDYKVAKWQIFKNQSSADVAIVNANLDLPEIHARKISFSVNGIPADYELRDGWLVARGENVLEQKYTNLIGPHNAENLLAALAVADEMQISREATLEALRTYLPLPHRCEKVAEINGVGYINDSKATNGDAMVKALMAMSSPVILLAGGKDKGLDFSDMLPLLREKVKAIVLIGQMRDKLFSTWNAAVPCFRENSLSDAVDKAELLARSGDVVLLSPGCSSFDMFKSFEDRGDQFRALVKAKEKI